jgi:hypothetical protein
MSAPAPPANGHCGVVLVTVDAVEARGENHGEAHRYSVDRSMLIRLLDMIAKIAIDDFYVALVQTRRGRSRCSSNPDFHMALDW